MTGDILGVLIAWWQSPEAPIDQLKDEGSYAGAVTITNGGVFRQRQICPSIDLIFLTALFRSNLTGHIKTHARHAHERGNRVSRLSGCTFRRGRGVNRLSSLHYIPEPGIVSLIQWVSNADVSLLDSPHESFAPNLT